MSSILRIGSSLTLAAVAASIFTSFLCSHAIAGRYRHADVEAAIKHLSDSDHYERKHGVYVIGEMGPEGKDAVPRLIELLQKDPFDDVRGEAASALARIGPDAEPAIPALIAFMKSQKDVVERSYAPYALGCIGKQPDLCVAAMVETINHDYSQVTISAVRALGSFGAGARPAIPSLIQAMKNGSMELREAAAYSLRSIPAGKENVPALTELLGDEIDCVRLAAATSLGGAGSEAAAAVPALTKLVGDSNHDVAKAAITGLGAIGPDASAAVPALKDALKDKEIQQEASEALKQINSRRRS
jgi:HEAT repeat protein